MNVSFIKVECLYVTVLCKLGVRFWKNNIMLFNWIFEYKVIFDFRYFVTLCLQSCTVTYKLINIVNDK